MTRGFARSMTWQGGTGRRSVCACVVAALLASACGPGSGRPDANAPAAAAEGVAPGVGTTPEAPVGETEVAETPAVTSDTAASAVSPVSPAAPSSKGAASGPAPALKPITKAPKAVAPADGAAAPGGQAPTQTTIPTPGSGASPGQGAAGSGQALTASDVGITPTSIRLGSINSVTGPLALLGYPAFAGQTFLRWRNENGGFNGRKFEFKFYDDNLDCSRGTAAAKKLVDEDKIFAMYPNSNPFSLNCSSAVTDKAGMVQFDATSWAPHSVQNPFVFPVGLTTANDGHFLAQLAEKHFQPKRPAMLTANVDLSQQCGQEPRRYFQKLGKPLVSDQQTTLTEPDYTPYVLRLRDSKADALIFCYDGASLLRYYRAAERQNFKIPVIILRAGYDLGFADSVGPFANGLLVQTGPVPTPDARPLPPKVAEFTDVMTRYNPGKKYLIHPTSLGAWAAGFLLLEGLQRAGLNPTRKSLLEAMNSLVDFDWGFGRPWTANANAGKLTYFGFKAVRDPNQCAFVVELRDKRYTQVGEGECLDDV